MNFSIILKIAALLQEYGPGVLAAIQDILHRFQSAQPVAGAPGGSDVEAELIAACKKACGL